MPTFRERLVPGVGTLLAVCLLAPATLLVFLPISLPIGIVAAIVLTAGAIAGLVFSAPVILIEQGVLHAGRARIEVAFTGTPEAFRGADAVRARGVELDARAWTLLRGWVDPVLRIPIQDADDPVPYWVVSTRRPAALSAALAAAHTATP
ncbi:DUF3093 domain-containing protein [uncultured Amnibacterium sp.]|uniref:DUF3093 domain-containing protein n=1 Tax=uncultured Amnibacterium sp. TaxID=1631851 RepID=UPI0035C964C9